MHQLLNFWKKMNLILGKFYNNHFNKIVNNLLFNFIKVTTRAEYFTDIT